MVVIVDYHGYYIIDYDCSTITASSAYKKESEFSVACWTRVASKVACSQPVVTNDGHAEDGDSSTDTSQEGIQLAGSHSPHPTV